MLITIYRCLSYDSFPKYVKAMFTLLQSEFSMGVARGVLGCPWIPLLHAFLCQQPTAGVKNDMTTWWVPSLWHSVTCRPPPTPHPFEKSWLHPCLPSEERIFYHYVNQLLLLMASALFVTLHLRTGTPYLIMWSESTLSVLEDSWNLFSDLCIQQLTTFLCMKLDLFYVCI